MIRNRFEDMAMDIAVAASLRSEDPFKKVGCGIFNESNRLLSIGYNGLQHKQKVEKSFWKNRDSRRSRIIHAETNALSCITRYDNPYLIVTTLMPCSGCAINIAAYNIKKVIYLEDYTRDKEALNIFRFYKIELIKYKK